MLTRPSSAQNRTNIHYEGLTHNFGTWGSGLPHFKYAINIQPNIGLCLEQELGRYFLVEVGVNDYYTEFDAFGKPGDTASVELCNYAQFIQIPLRVKAKFNLFKNRLFIAPNIGANLTINSYNDIVFYDGNATDQYRKIPLHYEYTQHNSYQQYQLFFQTGVALEFISKSWKFGVISTYNFSIHQPFSYSSDILQTGFRSGGQYLSYQIRAGYAIRNFWQKRKNKYIF